MHKNGEKKAKERRPKYIGGRRNNRDKWDILEYCTVAERYLSNKK